VKTPSILSPLMATASLLPPCGVTLVAKSLLLLWGRLCLSYGISIEISSVLISTFMYERLTVPFLFVVMQVNL